MLAAVGALVGVVAGVVVVAVVVVALVGAAVGARVGALVGEACRLRAALAGAASRHSAVMRLKACAEEVANGHQSATLMLQAAVYTVHDQLRMQFHSSAAQQVGHVSL